MKTTGTMYYHFGVGAPPILVYFSWDWDGPMVSCRQNVQRFLPDAIATQEWQRFLRARNVAFQAVARGRDERKEANDDAIQAKIRQLADTTGLDRLALLSADTGFLRSLQDCIMSGTEVTLFTPEKCFGAAGFYEANGILVQKLPAARNTSKIRALLYDDGTGAVNMAEPYAAFCNEENALQVMDFLRSWGYLSGEGVRLVQPIAKFWFSNEMGTLTVFPSQLATMALSDAITSFSGSQSWRACDSHLAFFLPVSSAGKGSAAKFGTRLARRIFRGGGPFILNDSADLTSKALTKLGYLDDKMNADLAEAMFCFVNCTDNKQHLRKLNLLPAAQATTGEVDRILHQAFLSNNTDAQWRIGPGSLKAVQQLLVASDMLPKGAVSQEDVFAAMEVYSRRHYLPEMQTFNGRAWRIMRFNDTNPTKRGVIEIALP